MLLHRLALGQLEFLLKPRSLGLLRLQGHLKVVGPILGFLHLSQHVIDLKGHFLRVSFCLMPFPTTVLQLILQFRYDPLPVS